MQRATARGLALAVVVLVGLAGADAAYGCTCGQAAPPSSAAVDGEEFFVLGLETPKPTGDLARVQVLEVLRGSARLGVADVFSDASTCGYGFVPGETYLIDAWRNAGTFATSICSRTRRAKEAAADLKVLRRR